MGSRSICRWLSRGTAAAVIPLLLACGAANSARPGPPAAGKGIGLSAREQELFQQAEPIMRQYCAGCHAGSTGRAAAVRRFDFEVYPTRSVAGAIGKSLGAKGTRPTMPLNRPGIVQGHELRTILNWLNSIDSSPSGGLARDR